MGLSETIKQKRSGGMWQIIRIGLYLILAVLLGFFLLPFGLCAREETHRKMVSNNLHLIDRARNHVMVASNYQDYASINIASVDELMDEDAVSRMKWPLGVILMESEDGKQPKPIPGGEVRRDATVKQEAWERFVQSDYLTIHFEDRIYRARKGNMTLLREDAWIE